MKKRLLFLLLGLFVFSIKLEAQTISTYAGSTQGYAEGTGATAQFNRPYGIAYDGGGAVVITDQSNRRVRIVYSNQQTGLRAGSGNYGNINGTGAGASFGTLAGIARDGFNNSFVCDVEFNIIKKITSSGVVTTFAGGTQGTADGLGAAAEFDKPYGITCDVNNILYVADTYNHRVRKITTLGEVTTLAGSTQGYTDAMGTNAQFTYPSGITTDNAGNIYVTDGGGTRIRKITPTGEVTTLATGFSNVSGITVDNHGNLYVADAGSYQIKKVSPIGIVSNYAGLGYSGSADGDVSVATFSSVTGLTIDKGTNILYVADNNNHRIRKIVPPVAATAPTIASINSVVTSSSASISYTINANNGPTTSIIKYGLTSNNLSGQVTGFSANGNSTTSSNTAITSLQASTQYFYQIEATNSAGTTTSSILNFTTNAPFIQQSIAEYNFNNTYNNNNGNSPFAANGGTSFITDRHGNLNSALNINNTGTVATITGLPYGSDARTISIWVKINSFNAFGFNFIYGYGNGIDAIGSYINPSTAFHYGNNNNHNIATTNNTGNWYHFVFVYDGANSIIYKDGTLLSSTAKSWNTLNNNSDIFRLGLSENGAASYFNGAVDDLKIFNYALSSTQVSSLFTTNTLPVTLTSFTAKAQNNSAVLNWETASETNNRNFVIKRSIDGINFSTLTTVEAKSANGAKYQFVDHNPANGTNYYQLLQVDLDGKTTDLGVKTVSFSIKDAIKVFPNPATDKAEVTFSAGNYTNAKLTDINGRILQNISISKLQQAVTLSLGNYPKGLYLLQLQGDKEKSTQKIIKQ